MKVGAGLVAGLLMLVAACASAPSFTPPPAVSDAFLREMAVTKAEDGIRVSATIPSREEARSIFGIDLREQGIQPLWLEIENGREGDIYFLPTGLDPEYFAPLEVAFLYKGAFADHAALGEHLQALNFDGRSPILAGATVSGFVYLYAVDPSLVAQVDLIGRRWSKRFSLFVPVPGTESAQRRIAEMQSLYAPADFIEIRDERQLRAVLEDLACCTSDESGAPQGPPINLVLIGEFEEIAESRAEDKSKRAVTFSLCDLRLIIEPDGTMRDESTGITVGNRLKRALALLCGVSWSGYHMLADDAATQASTRELHAFLDRVFRRSAAPRRASASPRPASRAHSTRFPR